MWEDCLWFAILPCGAYAVLGLSALFLRKTTPLPPFAIGGAATALLLIGIHNAWDTVTHIVVVGADEAAADPTAIVASNEADHASSQGS